MRLNDYPEKDGKQVWLDRDDLQDVVDEADDSTQRLAFLLAGRAGLRRSEIVSVTPNDFEHAPDGFLRVWEDYAKRDRYRETPVPPEVTHTVRALADGLEDDEAVIDFVGSTVYRWVQRAAERRHEATGDEGWTYLDVHDLRRTWGGDLLWNQGVLPSVVMKWGGWDDWETFKEHYLGEMSPEAAERERSKISYMDGHADVEKEPSAVFQPRIHGRS